MYQRAKVIFLAAALVATNTGERSRSLAEDAVSQVGERLTFECFTCHRRDGKDLGIPGLTGMSEADIVTALTLYKTGLRPNRAMVSVAAGLDQSQMAAVARYLSRLAKP